MAENNKDAKSISFKKIKDFYPTLESIVKAQLGDSLHALKVLEALIIKFDNKESFEDFENQYLIECLKKMAVMSSDDNCNDPYINDPFNLKKKEKKKNTTGLSGNKKISQEICYKEVTSLIRHHEKIMETVSCKVKVLKFLECLEWSNISGFIEGKVGYADDVFLDYSKTWSKTYIYEIIVKVLEKKYSILLSVNTVRLYLSDNKDLLINY